MITTTPVENTNNWKSWDIECLDADTTVSFPHHMGFGGAAPGVSVVAKAFVWGPHSAKR
jgi:hypothetical protein